MSPLTRRNFLKLLMAITGSSLSYPLLQSSGDQQYSGFNLSEWEVALGNGSYVAPGEPPISLEDIDLIHYPDHSELIANKSARNTMVNAIAFKRILTNSIVRYIYTGEYKFMLPYKPSTSEASPNGETIEGHLSLWDGVNTKLEYLVAFQWVVTPWKSACGDINVWNNPGVWQKVGYMDPFTNCNLWHTVQMKLDIRHATTSLVIDEVEYPSFLVSMSHADWDNKIAARLAAEVISLYPHQGIGALHKAYFKDWLWIWDEPDPYYLPIGIGPYTPPASPTPTLTPEPPPTTCTQARFASPVADQVVSSPFVVTWVPSNCRMVLQAYQGYRLIYENKKARSGIEIALPAGKTELKIWVSGMNQPAQAIWITIA